MWTHGSNVPRTDAGIGARLRRWWEHLSLPPDHEAGVRPAAGAPQDPPPAQVLDRLPALSSARPDGAVDYRRDQENVNPIS